MNIESTTDYRGHTINECERFTEDDYREMLNDCYDTIHIGTLEYEPADVLESVDPIAYRCGFSDMQEYIFTIDDDDTEYDTPADARCAIDAIIADESENDR